MKKLIPLSVICGLLSSYAMAITWIYAPFPAGTTNNNCNALQACIVYDQYVGLWDPVCCSVTSGSPVACTNYSVEEWTCAAGPGARYRNYKATTTTNAVSCHASPVGCY